MIIIRLRVNKQFTTEHWKQMAVGVQDEYGNPFRLVRLRWNKSPLHKMADYTKTRGFEDAIISQDRGSGDLAISYRSPGSIQWLRPAGNVGPFMGEVAVTPKNMRRLASVYGERLFTILDPDIDRQVKTMYEKLLSEMTVEQRKAHEDRIRNMHRMFIERGDTAGSEAALEAERVALEAQKMSISEQNRMNQIKAQDLSKREEALNMREGALEMAHNDRIADGAAPVTYSREFLQGKKIHELRKLAREVGVDWSNDDKRDAIVEKIIARQDGTVVAATAATREVDEALDV